MAARSSGLERKNAVHRATMNTAASEEDANRAPIKARRSDFAVASTTRLEQSRSCAARDWRSANAQRKPQLNGVLKTSPSARSRERPELSGDPSLSTTFRPRRRLPNVAPSLLPTA